VSIRNPAKGICDPPKHHHGENDDDEVDRKDEKYAAPWGIVS
jgi:hypothetical protein